MSWAGPDFVIAIIAISTGGWLISSWIRARHGYPIENEWSGVSNRSDIAAERKIDLLSQENGQLKGMVGRLEERIAVIERIVTDRGHMLATEIEQLRGPKN
jgi:hypothetical protein